MLELNQVVAKSDAVIGTHPPSAIPLDPALHQLTMAIGGKSFDRLLHAWQARWTGSLSGIG